jgi:TatD DNase family protein
VKYIDAHCHIDQFPKPMEAIARAEAAGVVTVAVTELPSKFERLALRLGRRPSVRLALGLHPLRAAAVTPMELALFTELLDRTDYVGEVGLDGSQHGRGTLTAQAKIFEHLLQQPRVCSKVLTVHSRGAEAQTVERLAGAGVSAILHWYSGPLKHIDDALSAGLWFSVNGAMLASKNGQKIVAAIPHDRLVTETDGPYSKTNGRANEPKDIPEVVMRLARLWGRDREEVRAQIFDNMSRIAAGDRAGTSPAV